MFADIGEDFFGLRSEATGAGATGAGATGAGATDDKPQTVPEFKPNKKFESRKISTIQKFYESTPKYNIGTVAFSMYDSEELMERISVNECKDSKPYGLFTVNSLRMGTMDRASPCITCGLSGIKCPGHLGHIKLAVPLPHPLAMDIIVNLLQIVCSNCARVLLPKDQFSDPSIAGAKGVRRLAAIAKLVSSLNTITCPRNLEISSSARRNGVAGEGYCPTGKFKYVKSRSNIVAVSTGKSTNIPPINMSMEKIQRIFSGISPEDLQLLGFFGKSHPKNFIMRAIPVIPERNRPPMEREGEKKPDQITNLYMRIIQLNNKLLDQQRNVLSQTDDREVSRINGEMQDTANMIFAAVSNIMSNSDDDPAMKKDEPIKSIAARLAGKDGVCRQYTQGKRVNNSGRTVIGPGIVPFGGLILPDVMRKITVPERVNFLNFGRISDSIDDIVHITHASGPLEGVRMFYPLLRQEAEKLKTSLDATDPSDEQFEILSEKYENRASKILMGDLIERLGITGDDVMINRQPTLHRHSLIGTRAIHKPGFTNRIHMSYTKPMNADFDGDEMNVSFPQTIESRVELRLILSARNQIVGSIESVPKMALVFNCPIAAYLLSKDKGFKIIQTEEEWNYVCDNLLESRDRESTISTRLDLHGIEKGSGHSLISLAFPENFFYKNGNVTILNGIFVGGNLTKKDVSKSLIHALYSKYGNEVTSRFISEAQFLLDYYYERRGYSIGIEDALLRHPDEARKIIDDEISKISIKVESLSRREGDIVTQTQLDHQEFEINQALRSIMKAGKELARTDITGTSNQLQEAIESGAKGSAENMLQIAGALGEQFVYGKRPERQLYGNRASPYFDMNDESIEAHGFVAHSYVEGMTPSEFGFHMQWSRTGILDTNLKTAESGMFNRKISRIMENFMMSYYGGIISTSGNYTSFSYAEGYAATELIPVSGFASTGTVYFPINLRDVEFEFKNRSDAVRRLSQSEIREVLEVVPDVQAVIQEIADYNKKKILTIFEKHLSEIEIDPDFLQELKDIIKLKCLRSMAVPGESVGLHAGEAISEPVTQHTLNTFHHTGGSSGEIGLSSFNDIFNISKNRKEQVATIHFKNKYMTHDDVLRKSNDFFLPTMKSLLLNMKITRQDAKPDFYKLFFQFFDEIPNEVLKQPFLRLSFDTFKLFENRVSTKDISDTLENLGGVRCVFSPTILGIVDVYYDMVSQALTTGKSAVVKKNTKTEDEDDIPSEFITPDNYNILFLQILVMPKITNSQLGVHSDKKRLSMFKQVEVVSLPTTSFIDQERKSGKNKRILTMKIENAKARGFPLRSKIQGLLKSLPFVQSFNFISEREIEIETDICPNVDMVSAFTQNIDSEKKRHDSEIRNLRTKNPLVKKPEDSELLKNSYYVFMKAAVATQGVQVLKTLITHPEIDPVTTSTNNPHEIHAIRGIEAARAFLYRDMYDLIVGAIQFNLNPKHMQIIADVMIASGDLMPFTARGSAKKQTLGAYSESSFEQALQAYLKSAVSGAPETITSTSASIMIGSQCVFGSGMFKTVANEVKSSAVRESAIGSSEAVTLEPTVNQQDPEFICTNTKIDDSAQLMNPLIADLLSSSENISTDYSQLLFPPPKSVTYGSEALPVSRLLYSKF